MAHLPTQARVDIDRAALYAQSRDNRNHSNDWLNNHRMTGDCRADRTFDAGASLLRALATAPAAELTRLHLPIGAKRLVVAAILPDQMSLTFGGVVLFDQVGAVEDTKMAVL